MNLSIVIPAYNEEKRIEKSLELIVNFALKNTDTFELIIVDDGSSDNTFVIVKNFSAKKKDIDIHIIRNQKNQGKGFSVKRGVLEAQYEYILFTDADLSTPINEFFRLYEAVNSGYDIAIGSRGIKSKKVKRDENPLRRVMGIIFNFFVRCLLISEFKDTQCGFKLFTNKAVKLLFPIIKIKGFGFDLELLFLAKKQGLRIIEIPVNWTYMSGTKVNIIKDSIKMFTDILIIRFFYILKLYKKKNKKKKFLE